GFSIGRRYNARFAFAALRINSLPKNRIRISTADHTAANLEPSFRPKASLSRTAHGSNRNSPPQRKNTAAWKNSPGRNTGVAIASNQTASNSGKVVPIASTTASDTTATPTAPGPSSDSPPDVHRLQM